MKNDISTRQVYSDRQANSDKSEEVQAIIDRMPTQWARYGAVLTGLFMGILIILGYMIKYPDTVDGQITITAHNAPVRLVSNYTGRIHLLKATNSLLEKGDVISYIESGANYKHILLLDSILQAYNIGAAGRSSMPINLLLGEVSSAFNTFVVAYTQYGRLVTSNIYETMRQNLQKQIFADQHIVFNVDKEILLKEKVLKLAYGQLQKDSILLSIRAMSDKDFQIQKSSYLSLEEILLSLQSDRWMKLSEISKNQLDIQRITLEETDSKAKAYAELMSNKNELTNAVSVWKDRYIQYSPIAGELEYLGFWRDNSFVQSGQELFSVIPGKNKYTGEVAIPSFGAGKVKVGQTANVKINNYPNDEYGQIKGVVQSVSKTTNKIQTKEGNVDAYLVTISLPDGMITNFGKQLSVNLESKGTIEIITNKKRLIERLFDNLKSKTEK